MRADDATAVVRRWSSATAIRCDRTTAGRPRGPGRRRPGAPGVVALAVHQLTPELAESLAIAELAVFVDARLAEEGTDIDLSPVEPSSAMGSGGHISDPRSLLAMAEWLYGHAPRAWLLTFPGTEFSIGEDLSAMAARGIDRALERIAILRSAGGQDIEFSGRDAASPF